MTEKFRIRMAGPKKAEILIYEDIGEGWFGGVGAKTFAEQVKGLGDLQEINVRINSGGGDVFEGFAIYNTLVRNKARVVVDVDGMALSAASVIAMAGNEIRMAENALMMIHDPWTVAMGNAADMQKAIDLLETIKGNIVTTYAKRTGADVTSIEKMMSAETWFTAKEAVEEGFADSVTESLAVAAKFDPQRFRNVPESILNRALERPRERLDLVRARIRECREKAYS